jgi:periplasmic protein TonB
MAVLASAPIVRPEMTNVRVSQGATAPVLISQVKPVYPRTAHDMHVQGAVVFDATISSDGHVRNLHLVSGHPLLVQAARIAVADWLYRPSQLNGQPHEANTQITVNFVLPK